MCRLRHINDSVLSSLKMEDIRLLFIVVKLHKRFYMNIFYVIRCKNIHTVLLKLYNQFYMNILYEIIRKNVHTFMTKILLANLK
jgi:hypothetical protein